MPSAGAGKFFNILSAYVSYNYVTTPYSSSKNLGVIYMGDVENPFVGIDIESTFNVYSYGVNNKGQTVTIENQPIYFSVQKQNPTNGDGTIDVYITYIISDF